MKHSETVSKEGWSSRKIALRSKNEVVFVELNEIAFIEKRGRKCILSTSIRLKR